MYFAWCHQNAEFLAFLDLVIYLHIANERQKLSPFSM